MKNILLLSTIFLLLSCSGITEEERIKADAFNHKLVQYTKPITNEMNALFNLTPPLLNNAISGSIDTKSINVFEIKLASIKNDINLFKDSINTLTEFDTEIKFKETSINYLMVSEKSLDTEYTELFNILQEEITNENIIKIGDLVLTIWDKLITLEKSTKLVQGEFAKKYSIELGKDPQDWALIEAQYIMFKKSFEQSKKQLLLL